MANRLYADQHDLDPTKLTSQQEAEGLGMYNDAIRGRGRLIPVDTIVNGVPGIKYLYESEARALGFIPGGTASERAAAGQREKLDTLLDTIGTLALGTVDPQTGEVVSSGIFNSQGVWARLKGWIRGGLSYVNYDPAAAEYNSLLIGFSPILARSIGHTGVLTQVDVESTVQLFPKLGDSQEVATRKLTNVMKIMSGELPPPFEFGQPGEPAFVLDAATGQTWQAMEDGSGWFLVQ